MSVDNVYSFTVQRQNSSEMPPGKSPCVKIKFIKDEAVPASSQKLKIGYDDANTEITAKSPSYILDEIKSECKMEVTNISQMTSISATETTHEFMRRFLTQLLAIIQKRDSSGIFAVPVVEDHAPNYHTIIARPMDLHTIRSKINEGAYMSVAHMLDDIVLMLHNAVIYNDGDTVYHRISLQLLNFTKKSFSMDHLNKFIQTKLSCPRALSSEHLGDINGCINRINTILSEIPKNRPNRVTFKNTRLEFLGKKHGDYSEGLYATKSKRQCREENDSDTIFQKEKTESEVDGSSVMNHTQSEVSVSEEESDDDVAEEVLILAQRAAAKAKSQLKRLKQRPIVYFDQRGDDVCVVNAITGSYAKVGVDLNKMVKSISSVDLEEMLGDSTGCLSQVHQLCYDSNECVTLTTSKPLEPYSFAEQAVLVETFGNVITAEYACNMHNYVLELPSGSAAVELVRSRLNAATNYLTYGVDQIITKKLKAANKP